LDGGKGGKDITLRIHSEAELEQWRRRRRNKDSAGWSLLEYQKKDMRMKKEGKGELYSVFSVCVDSQHARMAVSL